MQLHMPNRKQTNEKMHNEKFVSVLLIVDYQKKYYSGNIVSRAFPEVPDNVSKILKFWRECNNPIIHIRAHYTDRTSRFIPFFRELHPERSDYVYTSAAPEPFAQEIMGEQIVLKPTWDAFVGTNLDEILQSMNVKNVYLCGLLTSRCVLSTALHSYWNGYRTYLVKDCCGDISRENHQKVLDLYDGFCMIAQNTDEIIQEHENSSLQHHQHSFITQSKL